MNTPQAIVLLRAHEDLAHYQALLEAFHSIESQIRLCRSLITAARSVKLDLPSQIERSALQRVHEEYLELAGVVAQGPHEFVVASFEQGNTQGQASQGGAGGVVGFGGLGHGCGL